MAYATNRFGRCANRSSRRTPKEKQPYETIEYGQGIIYRSKDITVYEIDTYPRGSVLEGQQRRTFIDTYPTIAAAKAAHPNATCLISEEDGHSSSTFQEPCLNHLPDSDGVDMVYEDWIPSESN